MEAITPVSENISEWDEAKSRCTAHILTVGQSPPWQTVRSDDALTLIIQIILIAIRI